jgi:putative ABC transport system permease protein
MFRNYLLSGWRNIIRGKIYSALIIGGLAIGMACSTLILLWVQDENSYDRFNLSATRTARLVTSLNGQHAALTPVGLSSLLKGKFPQVSSMVRITQPQTNTFGIGARRFEEKRVLYADSNFLRLFTYPLAEGDPATALSQVNGVLITQEMAKKYFGAERAIGKILSKDDSGSVVVTGVLADIPATSSLQFDFVLPITAMATMDPRFRDNSNDFLAVYTYFQFHSDLSSLAPALSSIEARIDTIYSKEVTLYCSYAFQPLTDIHLRSHLQGDISGIGNLVYVRTFFIVSLFVLIIACINFMNLATARSARRAREVGVRKVIGASRGQLIRQFLGESLLVSLISLGLALLLVWTALPFFNQIAEKKLTLDFGHGILIPSLIGITLVTGLFAGVYPALFLSGFTPVKVLKSSLSRLGSHSLFRNILVTGQFVVSIVLLTSTIVIYRQLSYIRNRDLGFQKANLLYMPVTGAFSNGPTALRTALAANPLTADYTFVSQLPAHILGGWLNANWPGKDPNANPAIPVLATDEHLLSVFHMQIAAGRGFSPAMKTDSGKFLVNEKALQVMGMTPENAVGKIISFGNEAGAILGVVKDFNFKPVQEPIGPLFIYMDKESDQYHDVVIRTRPGATEATINALATLNGRLNAAHPFSYGFIDQDIENLYKSERRLSDLLKIFAALAIFISCLGLYGLSAFMAERRTKEISLRKVLGASVGNLVYLLSSSFTRLVLLAIVIAIPLSWYAANVWLNSFAYQINITWSIFAIASLGALVVALVTVSFESIRAAVTNPATNLRTD